MASLTGPEAPSRRRPTPPPPPADDRKAVHDGLILAVGGQVERALGVLTALALRWGLDPARLGVYTGLRLYLDNTNRTSLGVGLGAVQEIPALRAAGRFDEARRVADVAHTVNTLTCLAYASALLTLAAWGAPGHAGGPLAAEWTWGLAAVAGLTLVKRYETFLVAVLRAEGAFALTAELDLVESLASAAAVALGLWLAGFWGLLGAVAVLLLAKIAYAHARHPLRFRFAWHGPTAWRLMKTGLPILANTAVFGAVQWVDRALILGRVADGARAAGLYSVALMGTGWAFDLAGRFALVAYNAFLTALGRDGDPTEVARLAARATEAQAPLLLAGSAAAYLAAPAVLGAVMPRYVDGLAALRPLMPGMVLLSLTWPARQMLIAVGRPGRLFAATLAGLAVITAAGTAGADRAGFVGVAWGMTVGYAALFAVTSASALVPGLGWRGWLCHLGRLARPLAGFSAAALLCTHSPTGLAEGPPDLAVRCGLLGLGLALALRRRVLAWGRGGFGLTSRLWYARRRCPTSSF